MVILAPQTHAATASACKRVPATSAGTVVRLAKLLDEFLQVNKVAFRKDDAPILTTQSKSDGKFTVATLCNRAESQNLFNWVLHLNSAVLELR